MEGFGDSEEKYSDEIEAYDNELEESLVYGEKAKILSTEEIYRLMSEEIGKIKDVTELTSHTIRKLLNNFNWDTEILLEKIYLDDAKVKELLENDFEKVQTDISQLFTCEVCFEASRSLSSMKIFQCNHRFCAQCTSAYLRAKISEGGLLSNCINCPGFKCKYELSDEFVLQNVDSQTEIKYKQMITNGFVQNNKRIQWCPNADCQYAVKISFGLMMDLMESVRCKCSFWFCFKCGRESHDPVTCEMLNEWFERLKDKKLIEEVKSYEWIVSHTRKCPKCNVNIEKNGGCNHISCRNCEHEYCWICNQPWRGHRQCAGSEDRKAKTLSPEFSDARRLEMYKKQYDILENSYTMDVGFYKSYLVFGVDVELEMQWVKNDFVAESVDMLIQCRRTLMHLEIFMYFMTTVGNEVYILEDLGKNLHKVTEDLSFTLENNINLENVYVMKSLLITKTATCKSCRARLLDYVKEGNEKEVWKRFPIPAAELLGREQIEYS